MYRVRFYGYTLEELEEILTPGLDMPHLKPSMTPAVHPGTDFFVDNSNDKGMLKSIKMSMLLARLPFSFISGEGGTDLYHSTKPRSMKLTDIYGVQVSWP